MNFFSTASVSDKVSFVLTETAGNETLTLSDSNNSSSSYTYGSGVNQITNAVAVTGILTSGSSLRLDLQSIPQTTFRTTQNINFTGVKNFTVFNTSTGNNQNFRIMATGTNACTNVFGGVSGNILIKPYSSYSTNDPFSGFAVSGTQRFIYLNATASGVSYKMFILGLT